MWGKQARVEELLDLDDVAAGYVTQQRWVDNDRWVYGPHDAHAPLVDEELWSAVQARLAVRSKEAQRGTRSPRTTSTPYVLRGLLYCGICERKMQGSSAHDTLRYRCVAVQTRALPEHLKHHPKALYVREDAVVRAVDRWLPTIADGEWIATCQDPGPGNARQQQLRARLAEIDLAIANLVSAIEAGTDPAVIQPRISQLSAERALTVHELGQLHQPAEMTKQEIDAILTEVGGMTEALKEALPPERASVYQNLGLHLRYEPDRNRVFATADLGHVLSRVGGATRTSNTRPSLAGEFRARAA